MILDSNAVASRIYRLWERMNLIQRVKEFVDSYCFDLPILSMDTKIDESKFQLLIYGLLLAGIKLVYLFFDPYGVLDLPVFLTAGFLLGGKVPSNQRFWGLLLALPTVLLCLFFVMKNGYSSILSGMGTSFAISLVLVPLATGLGLWVRKRRNL